MRTPLRTPSLVLVTCLPWLAACGGGGGDDGPSAPSIRPVTPPSVSTAVNVGDRAALPLFSIRFAGDLEQLTGKTVYVLLEDPDGIVEGDPELTVIGAEVQVGLLGVVLTEVGVRSGELVFHACYDLGCDSELPGSPTTADYSFEVGAGLVVDSPDTVEVAVDFGDDPAPLAFAVTLPAGASELEVTRPLCSQDYAGPLSDSYFCNSSALGPPVQSASGPLVVRVDPGLGWPGTYADTLRFRAVSNVNGYPREFTREIVVRYTIAAQGGPDAILFWQPVPGEPAVFIDPAVGIEVEVASQNIRYLGLGAYTKAAFVSWPSADYASGVPAGGDPEAPYQGWFYDYGMPGTAACTFVNQERHCMLPGTYEATVHGTVAGDPSADVVLPIRMRVLAIP